MNRLHIFSGKPEPKNEKVLKQRSVIAKLFRSSVVSMIAAAMAAMLGMLIDGIIIGSLLGTDCMAAYGLILPVLNLATAIAGVLALGAQVVCAQRLGMGSIRGARKAFSMLMVTTLVIAAAMMAVFFFFREPICMMLGARGDSAKLLGHAVDYLTGLLPAFPSVLILLEFNSLMRLDADANRVIVAVSVMTVLDVVGNLLNALVFHGGMLVMGLTTSGSYFVALVILLFHFRKKDIIFRMTFKGLRLRDLGAILSTGSSSGMGSGCAMLRIAVINQLMIATALSSVAVAAFGTVNTVISFVSGLMVGIGMTCAMIAGMILGEQDRTAAEVLVKVTVKLVLTVSVVLAAVLLVFADVIAAIFKGGAETANAEQTARLVARGLRFYAVAAILYGVNNAFVNYTQGMRRMGLSNVVCFLQNFVYIVIPASILSGLIKGERETDAVWISFILCELLTSATIFMIAAVQKHGLPRDWKDFLFLRKGFGVPEENLFETSIFTEEELTPAVEAVRAFCESNGADARCAELVPLAVNELCGNALRHDFVLGKHSIDVRVMCMDNSWILRLRDNCNAFDPTAWLREHEEKEDSVLHRLSNEAQNIKYLSTLNLNNLTVRF